MLLELKNIKKSFGQKKVLNEINLSLSGNGLYLIDGVNGAGKTTLLKIIGAAISPYSIYMMNNGTLMDVGALILLPFAISLLIGLFFFLACYRFQAKPKK